jgi:RNA polymerase sigma factor for flagellar operon FliA
MELQLSSIGQQIDLLWERFHETRGHESKKLLSMHYLGVVRSVVRAMKVRSTSPLEESDLEQIGFIGLGDAIDRFDPTRGVKFETYAQPRIRGTIWDELRRLDWVPRTVREQVARFRQAEEEANAHRDGDATSEEILEVLRAMGGDALPADVHVIESLDRELDDRDGDSIALRDLVPSGADDVLTTLIAHEAREEVLRIVHTLPATQCRVITAHYFDGIPFQDIAKIVGVTSARISQIHKQALTVLGGKLREIIN